MQTETAYTNPLTRDDTLLGVCQALGEDFGFNPLWLRVVLAVGLLWNPQAMIGAYLALGALVLVSRLIVPGRRRGAAGSAQVPVEAASTDREAERLPLAA